MNKKKRKNSKIDWDSIDKEVIPNIKHYSIMEISRIFNIRYMTVYNHYMYLDLLDKFRSGKFKYDWESIDKEILPKINKITMKDVAKFYNIPYESVLSHYKKLKITYKFKRVCIYDWDSIEKEMEDNPNNLRLKDISKIYNIPYPTVYFHFRKIGIVHKFYK